MSTLFESSLPLLLLGGIVTVGCVVGWLKTADRRLWIGIALGIVVAVLGVVLERMVVTDRELVERVIYAVAADIRADRTEAAVQHIRPDDEDLRSRARTELKLYKVTEINIKRPIEITLTPEREPTKAKAVSWTAPGSPKSRMPDTEVGRPRITPMTRIGMEGRRPLGVIALTRILPRSGGVTELPKGLAGQTG
jgi:hypothetical protein